MCEIGEMCEIMQGAGFRGFSGCSTVGKLVSVGDYAKRARGGT